MRVNFQAPPATWYVSNSHKWLVITILGIAEALLGRTEESPIWQRCLRALTFGSFQALSEGSMVWVACIIAFTPFACNKEHYQKKPHNSQQ